MSVYRAIEKYGVFTIERRCGWWFGWRWEPALTSYQAYPILTKSGVATWTTEFLTKDDAERWLDNPKNIDFLEDFWLRDLHPYAPIPNIFDTPLSKE